MCGWSQLCKFGMLVYERELGDCTDWGMPPAVLARTAQGPGDWVDAFFPHSLPLTCLPTLSVGWCFHGLPLLTGARYLPFDYMN